MKKVAIFLDFDGVLNNFTNYRKTTYKDLQFNKENIESFYNFLYKFNTIYGYYPKIVINSSWKLMYNNVDELKNELIKKAGDSLDDKLKFIISLFEDMTPTFNFSNYLSRGKKRYSCKAFEIETYIVSNNLNESKYEFIIIDDENINTRYINTLFIKTNIMKGFDKYVCNKILRKIKE